jgi:ABC-type glycerol-3-phosphate transport system permease component
MEFPSLRGLFTYRNPTLKFDGEWNEYLWPFSDTKEQDMMNFQILLENGEGTVAFKNFEFLAN